MSTQSKSQGPRPLISVVGNARLAADDPRLQLSFEIGRALVDGGYRVVTGGLEGIMSKALEGAKSSSRYREGDTIALLPGFSPDAANSSADIVIATGMDLCRNIIVANSDAVVAVGGGSGTLSEIAFAWQLRRLVVGMRCQGWSGQLADTSVDTRKRRNDDEADLVFGADTAEEAAKLVEKHLPAYGLRHQGVA